MRFFLGVLRFLRDYPLCHKLCLNIVQSALFCRNMIKCEIMPPGV